METQDYNGWTNRETWATMLHIDNDQALSEIANDYASVCLKYDDEGEDISCLSLTLEEWITGDLLTLENISGNQGLWLMLTDIGSLYRVNWREIAEHLLKYTKELEASNA